MNYPTRFDGLLDLARLPWFEEQGGRLVLADRALVGDGAIDVHTHLALAYGTPPRVDLRREWPETEHYLPKERAIDFEVYINRNFSEDDLKRLGRDLTWMSVTGSGMRRTHTAANLRREMDELGIQRSVLLAIDYAALSRNSEWWLESTRGMSNLVTFGSVHPYTPFPTRRLDALVAAGARGVKVHPAVQMVAPDDRLAMRIYRLCGERSLPVLFHCGPVGIEPAIGRWLTQVKRYERAIAENPETQFVLGHAGALQMPQALLLAKRYPNVWLETSSQSLSAVRRLVAEQPDRLLFGTDWPFYHQAIGLAKVFMATGDDTQTRLKVLTRNAQTLFLLAPGFSARPRR
jgi:predicted TIM-barrel fold metal-dependent hydrolase